MFSLTTLVGIYKHYIDTYNTNFSYISILALLIHIEKGAYIDFIVFVKHHKTCILGVSYSWSKLINKIKLYMRQFTNSHTQQYKSSRTHQIASHIQNILLRYAMHTAIFTY